jgi:Flp pilus assembly protein TadG
MITQVREVLRKLRACASGNATLLVALAMPALIGATGYAVDTAQWYMWKRELQFATDQGAIAAAWAMSDSDTAGTYMTRGTQEYENNLAATADYATAPTIQLSDYNGGTNNSVIVTASVTRKLPFSSLIMGSSTTVSVSSQAEFSAGTLIYSCIIATDEHEDSAIVIGGSSIITAGCGMAALSDSPTAITVDGNPEVEVGTISAAGGIDDWFDTNGNNVVQENLGSGVLSDPYKDLTPPDNPTARTDPWDSCVKTGKGNSAVTIAAMQPGTYSNFRTKCDTTMASGIYVIDGGTLNVSSQYALTGNGVMFVLKNGAGIKINGGAAINLTAMTSSQLQEAGVSAADADKLAGMLIFEDPNSSGNDSDLINGNASTVLNGTVYLSKSELTFEGTASVTSQCLMLAANTLHISGDTNMTTFCPAGEESEVQVGSLAGTVKLVA